MSDESISDAAKALSRRGASKGGKARAQKLTPEERSESARRAATARWSPELPQATHGSPDHPLRIGNIEIPCYVLDNGKRVLFQRAMVSALGMARGSSGGTGGDRLAKFATGKAIKPFLEKKLSAVTEPIKFRTPSGGLAYGYEAEILAHLCEAVLKARELGLLQKQQMHIATRCEILLRGFARVGIVALVDEVTGYEKVRDRMDVHRILEAYIAQELLPWTKRFPDEFYRELFRLRGWEFSPLSVKRPLLVGKLTDRVVYKKLPEGVLDRLKKKNPKDEKGHRRHKHHQFLTDEVGNPHLEKHLAVVTALMRASINWRSFLRLLDRAVPTPGGTQKELFDKDEVDEEE